ncbi:hypothetical protein KR054_004818 [Drosophila jambulina]|nr:hypothetical protein KR054_004818 [Drosophila jambulina]
MAKKKGKKGKKSKVNCNFKITDDMLKPMNETAVADDGCEGCCQCDCDCSPEPAPCFIQSTRPDPGPEAYDEFEACLNGSGLTIRVLKNTHKVESVDDGAMDGGLGDDPNDDQDGPRQEPGLNDMMQRSSIAKNHIKRRTGGSIINHPNIPKVRANIKYSGNDAGVTDSYYVPFSKIKEALDQQENNVDRYRHRLSGGNDRYVPAQHQSQNQRNVSMQVEGKEIMDTMKGVNVDTRRKGIEVCYKTCDETDSDVFLVKLGSKAKSQHKKNTIEIELRTPKQAVNLPVSKVTTETYVSEDMLNAGKKKKGKKGKGKKGKGKKKK